MTTTEPAPEASTPPRPTGHSGAGLFSALLGFVLVAVGGIYAVAVVNFHQKGLLNPQDAAAAAAATEGIEEGEARVAAQAVRESGKNVWRQIQPFLTIERELAMLGLFLGLLGLRQSGRKQALTWAGLIMNGVVFLASLGVGLALLVRESAFLSHHF